MTGLLQGGNSGSRPGKFYDAFMRDQLAATKERQRRSAISLDREALAKSQLIKCPGPERRDYYDGRCVQGRAWKRPSDWCEECRTHHGGGSWVECPRCGGENYIPAGKG